MTKKNNSAEKDKAVVVVSPNTIATEPVSNGSVAQNISSDLTLNPILTTVVGQEKINENVTKIVNAGLTDQSANPNLMLNQDETFLDDSTEKPIGIPGLEVQSKQAGFRRAGRAWSTETTFVAAEDLTREQAEALLNEPMLIVTPAYKY